MKNNSNQFKRFRPYGMIAAVIPAFMLASSNVMAQQTAGADQVIEEVVTIGTRTKGRSAEDLPVPVDVLNAEAMANTGHTEVGRMLQSLAPSFNFSSSSISDGSDALRPATLRGLGPDQTLVLINGKRRHQASLIHINTSVGRGTAGVDMNAIPAASIKRIEVLRDGAAAQYGSDAIAGVINIILKDADEGGSVSASYGEYTEGDGETYNLDASKGFALGEAGFLNATFNYRDRGRTNRAGDQGACAYGGCVDTDMNGFDEIADPREITFDRGSFRIGDADSEQYAFTLNGAYNLGDGELYGFFTYSERENESGAFYRNPSSGSSSYLDDGDNVIPDGFLPIIHSQIDDLSVNIGYTMEFGNDIEMDISYTDGTNEIEYETQDSINYSYVNFLNFSEGLSDAEIRDTIPRAAMAYGLELGLQTINLDFNQGLGDLALAYGFEFRTDSYEITPGKPYAYADFDTDPVDGSSLFPQDGPGAIQGFNGIAPVSAVDEERDVYSLYVDGEYQFSADLLVSAAVRYDDYDDFGDTANYKLAANWALTDTFRLRGAISTGFRAPSMQQLYFNNISTQFVDDGTGTLVAEQRGTFRNDSQLAKDIGIPSLKEEESDNYSVGFVYTPLDQLSITLDFYKIDIDDRIILSGGLKAADDPSGNLGDALAASGATSAQFFLNGANTETEGFDLITTYSGIELGSGILDITFAANKTETDVTDIYTAGGLAAVDPDVVVTSQDVSIIEEWQPEDRINLGALYMLGGWNVNLTFNRFGEYTVEEGSGDRQTFGAVIVTDLNVRYAFDNGFSLNVGGNNIFDEYPDRNKIGNARGGALEDAPGGNVIVDSDGVFDYSRRSAPFGFNGAYWYAGATYQF